MIPQVQPFVPEYNFYSNVLQLKQGKYDAAREQLSTLYGSLLNAPLTRDDNAQTRDQFFKAIDQDIQRMSGVDLSLNQNFESAQGVFNQLLDNKYIVKDMVWTKNLYNQYQRADSFRNCTDPEKCGGGWWEGGERLLGYAANDFKNVSLEESMNMGNARFVPYQDITKRAIQIAKDADLNMKVDQITGQWIVTTKNGPMIAGGLQNLMMGSIANDPKVMEYYQAEAEVNRRDFMYSNKDVYGSEAAAEQAYINEMIPKINSLFGTKPQQLTSQIEGVEKKKKYLEKEMENSLPYKRESLEEMYNSFVQMQGGYQATLDHVNDVAGETLVAQNNQQYTGGQIDRMIASLTLQSNIAGMANTLSYRNYEQTIAANPYAVQAAAFRNSMLLQERKAELDLEAKEADYMLKAKYGVGLSSSSSGKGFWAGLGDPAANTPIPVDIPGSKDIGSTDEDSPEFKTRAYEESLARPYRETQADINSQERSLLGRIFRTTEAEAEYGNEQAKEDYIQMAKNVFMTQDTHERSYDAPPAARVGFQESMKPYLEKMDELSVDQQYALAKQIMSNYSIDEFGPTRVSAIYSNVATSIMDPNLKDGTMHKYLHGIWNETAPLRQEIEAKRMVLEAADEWHASILGQVANHARTMPEYGAIIGDAIESYFGTDGQPVDKATFIRNMNGKKKGYMEEYGYENLEALYEGRTIEGWDIDFPSISEIYKEVFTEASLKFQGDPNWAGLVGFGDRAAFGANYKNVDPNDLSSIGSMGFLTFMQDAFSNGDTRFDIGFFKESLPENNEEAKKFMNLVFTDYKRLRGDKSRPMLDITYSDIAGSDSNMVGLNIKLNQDYIKNYMGSEKDAGLMRESAETLMTSGMTVYMPRNKTQNLFTLGAEKSPLERMMNMTGQIKFDTYPDYIKDFAIKYNPDVGGYTAAGMYMNGFNEDGTPNWDYTEANYTSNTDLNQLVLEYDQMLRLTAKSNQHLESLMLKHQKQYARQ